MSAGEEYDDETAIEETPGYVGLVFDDFFSFSEGLKPLEGFDFRLYGIMADELRKPDRELKVDFGSGPSRVKFDACALNEIVEAIPIVASVYHCPPDQGPAGGSGYIFVLQDGSLLTECEMFAQALRTALDDDFEKLRRMYEEA